MKQRFSLLLASSDPISIPLFEALFKDERFEILGLLCQPDRAAGRKQILQPPAPKLWANLHSIPVFQSERLSRDEQLLENLKKQSPDALLTFAYGQILNSKWLSLAKKHSLNVHASLLPKYRGASPIQAALLAGDPETGLTLMRMEKGLDTGDLFRSFPIPVLPEDEQLTLTKKLADLAELKIPDALFDLLTLNTAPWIAQDESKASHCRQIQKEDAYIDFNESSEQILKKWKAYYVWPQIWTLWNGKRVKLLELSSSPEKKLKPGQWGQKGHELFIGTLNGALKVLKLHFEGKSPTSGPSFLSGNAEVLSF